MPKRGTREHLFSNGKRLIQIVSIFAHFLTQTCSFYISLHPTPDTVTLPPSKPQFPWCRCQLIDMLISVWAGAVMWHTPATLELYATPTPQMLLLAAADTSPAHRVPWLVTVKSRESFSCGHLHEFAWIYIKGNKGAKYEIIFSNGKQICFSMIMSLSEEEILSVWNRPHELSICPSII